MFAYFTTFRGYFQPARLNFWPLGIDQQAKQTAENLAKGLFRYIWSRYSTPYHAQGHHNWIDKLIVTCRSTKTERLATCPNWFIRFACVRGYRTCGQHQSETSPVLRSALLRTYTSKISFWPLCTIRNITKLDKRPLIRFCSFPLSILYSKMGVWKMLKPKLEGK